METARQISRPYSKTDYIFPLDLNLHQKEYMYHKEPT